MTPLLFNLVHDSPFHSGVDGDLSETSLMIHSDTIWGALCDTAHFIGEGMDLFHPGSSPLLVSSLFPRCGAVRFLPKPFVPAEHRKPSQNWEPGDHKRMKSVKFVSERVFTEMLAGENPSGAPRAYGFWANASESEQLPEVIIQSAVIPANTLDRLTHNAAPWRRAEVFVNTSEGCGTWFLCHVKDENIPALTKLVETLGRRGIGGERGIGKGRFHLASAPVPYTGELNLEPGNDTWFVSLSRFLPSENEVAQGLIDNAAYNTTVRGGWTGGFRKLKLRLCVEGSVFPSITPPPYGSIRDIAPVAWKTRGGHPLWLSGFAFPAFYTPGPKEADS